jgi:hypothetical protein
VHIFIFALTYLYVSLQTFICIKSYDTFYVYCTGSSKEGSEGTQTFINFAFLDH